MGHQWFTHQTKMMKSILFAALVAAAYYGYYGYARPYAYGYRSYGAYPYYRSYGYHAIGKRSADAEPAADADAYYYGYAAPYAYRSYGAYPYRAGYYGYW